MSILAIKHLFKKYTGAKDFAVHDVSMEIAPGELISLTGESGCGKTTLLRLIAGLEVPEDGHILINGQEVAGPSTWVKPEKRRVGMVFQDYALFPHLNVAANILYGLTNAVFSGTGEKKKRLEEVLRLVGLQGYELRYPHELSGGQQQRVALARALAPRPAILLLDEPFSNLDEMLREQLRDELCQIIRQTATTALLVTHDTRDALTTADRVAFLRQGRLLQLESPHHLYYTPGDEYTARFFGKANLLEGKPSESGLQTALGSFAQHDKSRNKVCIRPEDIAIVSSQEASHRAQVKALRFLGTHQEVSLLVGEVLLQARISNRQQLQAGETVGIRIEHYHLV